MSLDAKSVSTELARYGDSLHVALQLPNAANITLVTASGCDSSESWLDSSSTVLPPLRLAMNRCRSGLMVRSCLDTTYQLGLERQAAWVVLPASRVFLKGACTAYSRRALSLGRSPAKSLRNAASVSLPSSSENTMPALAGACGFFLASAV